MKPVYLNNHQIGSAGGKTDINWLLAAMGFRGHIATYVEEPGRFVLQAITRDGVPGYYIGAPHLTPSASVEAGDTA